MADNLQGLQQLEIFVNGLADDARNRDYSPVLTDFLSDLENAHEVYFASGSGPSGPWAPLAPSTVRRKGNAKILVDHGDLEKSLTGPGGDAVRVVERVGDATYLAYGTTDEKAPLHASGTSTMPQREPVGMTPDLLDTLTEKIADDAVREFIA